MAAPQQYVMYPLQNRELFYFKPGEQNISGGQLPTVYLRPISQLLDKSPETLKKLNDLGQLVFSVIIKDTTALYMRADGMKEISDECLKSSRNTMKGHTCIIIGETFYNLNAEVRVMIVDRKFHEEKIGKIMEAYMAAMTRKEDSRECCCIC